MSETSNALQMAEDIAGLLRERQIQSIVIGAVAMAAHHYVRFTEDIDLAVLSNLSQLRETRDALQQSGYQTQLHEPDAEDPLSGVIDVRNESGHVQIISFADRFPAVIEDALKNTPLTIRAGSSLKVVPIAHLVALKLYAGGLKSHADIVELLKRNPETPLDEIRALCDRYQLTGFDTISKEL